MQEEMDAQTTELAALRADAECLRSIVLHSMGIAQHGDGSWNVGGWNEKAGGHDATAATLPTAVAVLVAKLEATP